MPQAKRNKKPPFWFSTKKLYKIWFSNNKEVPLGIENELRLIRFRNANPKSELSLIYSSKCLSEAAIEKLKRFCEKFEIALIDFDTQIETLLKTPREKKLYQLAKRELDKAHTKEGGSFAASSDIIRVKQSVMEKLGVYSDLDVSLQFNNRKTRFKVKAPLVLPVSCRWLGENKMQGFFNSDFFGAALASRYSQKLHKAAIEKLELVQDKILDNYEVSPFSFLENELKNKENGPERKWIVEHFFKKNPNASLIDFRKYAENFSLDDLYQALPITRRWDYFRGHKLPEASLSEMQVALGRHFTDTPDKQDHPQHVYSNAAHAFMTSLKIDLVKASVEKFSGPASLNVLFDNVSRQIQQAAHEKQVELNDSEFTKQYCESLNLFGYESYPFGSGVRSANMLGKENVDKREVAKEIRGDISWTEDGANQKHQREISMKVAARNIQHAWRRFKATHHKKEEIVNSKKSILNPKI